MRKILAVLLIVSVLSLALAGCVKKTVYATESRAGDNSSTEISRGVSDIDSLNDELDTSELDSVDKELDSVNW